MLSEQSPDPAAIGRIATTDYMAPHGVTPDMTRFQAAVGEKAPAEADRLRIESWQRIVVHVANLGQTDRGFN